MFEPILLSFRVAIIATTLSFLFGLLFAYLINKKMIWGGNLWETLLIIPLVLPPSVVGYFLLILFGKRGLVGSFLLENFGVQIVFTWWGAVIAAFIVSLPLMYQNVKAGFLSVDPLYEQAARTLGSSEFKVFWTVTFPLAKPGIISGIILAFARGLGEFGATLMIAGNIPNMTQTMPTAIYYAVESGNTELANTLVLVMTTISFILIFTLNHWLGKNTQWKQKGNHGKLF
ncbi:MAG: molybdate ABC transporter permease subunit [Eubacteriaceae bacterium]